MVSTRESVYSGLLLHLVRMAWKLSARRSPLPSNVRAQTMKGLRVCPTPI